MSCKYQTQYQRRPVSAAPEAGRDAVMLGSQFWAITLHNQNNIIIILLSLSPTRRSSMARRQLELTVRASISLAMSTLFI
jgi:hypothetical protein